MNQSKSRDFLASPATKDVLSLEYIVWPCRETPELNACGALGSRIR